MIICITRSLVRIGELGRLGGRFITSDSFGSKMSIVPNARTVVILIHKIWTGRIGMSKPKKIDANMTNPSPKFVGSVQVMNLIRVSRIRLPSSTAALIDAKLSSV